MYYLVLQMGIILAVAAVLFFGLGVWYASGRQRDAGAEETLPVEPPAEDPELVAARARIAELEEGALSLEADLAKAREHIAPSEKPDGPAPTLGTELDPELGAVYAMRPEGADDLTQIRGVGKALARQLNDLGVYKLAQIAAWDKSQVEAFATRLAFKDRIRRDDWVGQAKRLAR